jgi:hypothetical protein
MEIEKSLKLKGKREKKGQVEREKGKEGTS